MRRSLTSALLLVTCCTPAALAQSPRPSLDKVLVRWVRAYDKGRIQLAGLAVAKGKVDPLYGRGWLGPPANMDRTHRAALITLLSRAAKTPNPRTMEPVIRLASKGLLDGSATFKQPHHSVRHLATLALPKFTTTACVFLLMQTADGEFDGWSKAPTDRLGARAAAILGLGAMRRPVVRPTLQRQIRAEERLIRLATADALGRMAHPQALPILESALAEEQDGMVVQACVQAINRTIEQNQEAVPTDLLRRILVAAIAALGRTDWRTDLEIVGFLGRVRSALAVEPLITVLEQFTDTSGPGPRPSRRLQLAAYDTLRSLTGAILPIDAPDRWREFWAKEKDRFVVAKPKQLEAARTAAGFFGVPVRGSNVLFLIDTSGSMAAGFMPAGEYDPTDEDDGLTRLEMARRELLKAVDALPGDAKFNLVSFDAGVHKWRRNLVRAGGKSRAALRQRLRQLKPAGATNIFGALKSGLEIKTLAYGSRYGTAVDEIFLLSDGEPTVGEVIATEAILAVIQETNRYSSVRINTLYMGGGGDSFFMRKLAEQNHGKYVRL